MASVLRENVETIRKRRGLSKAELSDRVKRDRAELDTLLESDRPPKTLIGALAEQLAVPDFALFMKNPKVEANIADFRESEPVLGAYEKSTIRAIEAGRNIKKVADDICILAHTNNLVDHAIGDDIPSKAGALRAHLSISDQDQLDAKDARVFYGMVRKKVESTNTFVTQYSFEDGAGFCLSASSGFDYICINKKNRHINADYLRLGMKYIIVLLINRGYQIQRRPATQ